MLRVVVQTPVELLALECLSETFQEAQLLRRAILNPHVAVLIPRKRHEPGSSVPSRQEALSPPKNLELYSRMQRIGGGTNCPL
jgi:hypothetical protein